MRTKTLAILLISLVFASGCAIGNAALNVVGASANLAGAAINTTASGVRAVTGTSHKAKSKPAAKPECDKDNPDSTDCPKLDPAH